jgi:octaprenyl-diphosphate synthase
MSLYNGKRSGIPEQEQLKELIQPDIEKIEETMQTDLSMSTAGLDDLLGEVLRYGLFAGGKRFRPLLAVLAARLCGQGGPDMYRLAIAFEYLHMATLFHDDVIDNADTRRGRPAVNRAYGMVPAILAGDFLHSRSMAIVSEYGGAEALKIFCQATAGMVDGEFQQLRYSTNFNLSEKDYFHIVSGKTALFIAATMEIGSLYGGGNDQERQALRVYGNNLGCSFQIIDDLLDYLGDQNATGKPVGNDLAEGKMTLPLILAMNKAEPKDRVEIIKIIENTKNRKNCLVEINSLILKYNGFSDSWIKAEKMIQEAVSQLKIFSHPDNCKDRIILEGLAQYVLTRNR